MSLLDVFEGSPQLIVGTTSRENSVCLEAVKPQRLWGGAQCEFGSKTKKAMKRIGAEEGER